MRKKIVISITTIIILLITLGLVVFYLFLPKENYQATSETEGLVYNSQFLDQPIDKNIDDIEDLKQNLYIAQKKYYEKKYANVEVKGQTDATQLGFGIKSQQYIDVKKIKNEQNQYLLMTSKGVLSSAYEVLITSKDEHKADFILRSSSNVNYDSENNFESAKWSEFISLDRNEFIKNMFGHNFSSFTEYTLNDKSIKNVELLEKTETYNTYRVDLHVGYNVEPKFVDASKRYAKEVKTQAGSKVLPNFEKVVLEVKLSKDWDVLEVVTNEVYKISKFGDVYTDTVLKAKFTYEKKQIPNYDLFKPYFGTKSNKPINNLDTKEIIIQTFTQLVLEYFNKISLDANFSIFGEEFDVKLQISLIAEKEIYFSIPKYNITGIYKNNKIYLDNNENHFSLEVNKLLALKDLFKINKDIIEGGKFLDDIKEKFFKDIELELLENKDRKITVNLDGNIIIFIINENNEIKLIDAKLNIGQQNQIKAVIKPSKEFITINKINDSIYQDKTDLILNLVNIFKDKKIYIDSNYIKLNDTYSIKVESNLIYEDRLYTDTNVYIKNTNGTILKVNIIQNGNNFYIKYKDVKFEVSRENIQNVFEFIKKVEKLDFNFDISRIDLEKSLFENLKANKEIFFNSNIKEEIQNIDFSFINNLSFNLDKKSLVIKFNEKELNIRNNKDYNLEKIVNIQDELYLPIDSYIDNIEDIYNLFKDKKFNIETRVNLDDKILDLNLKLDLSNNHYNLKINIFDNENVLLNSIDLKYVDGYLYINFNDRLYKERINLEKAKNFLYQFILINQNQIPSDLLKTIDSLIFNINKDEQIVFNFSKIHQLLENIKVYYNEYSKEFNISIQNIDIKVSKLNQDLNNFDKDQYQEINLIDSIFTKLIFNLENKEKDLEKIYEIISSKKYLIKTNYITINSNYDIKLDFSINLENERFINLNLILRDKLDNNKEYIFNIVYSKNSIYLTHNDLKVVFNSQLLFNLNNFIKKEFNLDLSSYLNIIFSKGGNNSKFDFDISKINLDFIKKFVSRFENDTLFITLNDYEIELKKEINEERFNPNLENFNNINLYIINIEKIYNLIKSKKYDLTVLFNNQNTDVNSKLLIDLDKKYYHIDLNILNDNVLNHFVLTYQNNVLYLQINEKLYKEEINFDKAYEFLKGFFQTSFNNSINILDYIQNLNIRFDKSSVKLNLEFLTSFIKDLVIDYNPVKDSILARFEFVNIELKNLKEYIEVEEKDKYVSLNILNSLIDNLHINNNDLSKLDFLKKVYKILSSKKYNIRSYDFIKINDDYSIKFNSNLEISNIITQSTEIVLKDKNEKTITLSLYSKGNDFYFEFKNLKVKTDKQHLSNVFKQLQSLLGININLDLNLLPLVDLDKASKFDFDISSINLENISSINLSELDNTVIVGINEKYNFHISNIELVEEPLNLGKYIEIDNYLDNFADIYNLIIKQKFNIEFETNLSDKKIRVLADLDLKNNYYFINLHLLNSDDTSIYQVEFRFIDNVLYAKVNNKFVKEELELNKFKEKFAFLFKNQSTNQDLLTIFDYINKTTLVLEKDLSFNLDLSYLSSYLTDLVVKYDITNKAILLEKQGYLVKVKKFDYEISLTDEEKQKYETVNYINSLVDKINLASDLYLSENFTSNLQQTISTSYSINMSYGTTDTKIQVTGKMKVLPKVNLDLDIFIKYNNYVVNAKLIAKDNNFLLTVNNLKFNLTFDEILLIIRKLNTDYVNNQINEDQLAFLKNVIEYLSQINLNNTDMLVKLTNDLDIKFDFEKHNIKITDNGNLNATLSPISEDITVELDTENALGYEQISKMFDIRDVVDKVKKDTINAFNLNVNIEKDGKQYTATGSIKSQRVSEGRIDIKLSLNLTYEQREYNVDLTIVDNRVYFIINNLKLSFDKQDLASSILTILKSINMNIPYLDTILNSKSLDVDTNFFEKMFNSGETEILSFINSLTVEDNTIYTMDVKSEIISSIKDYNPHFGLRLITRNNAFDRFELNDMYIDQNNKLSLSLNANPDKSEIEAPQDANTYKQVEKISKLVKALVKTASLKKYQLRGTIPVEFSGGLLMSSGSIEFEADIKLDENNKPQVHIKAFVPYLGEKSKIGYITAGKFNIEMYYKDGVFKAKDRFENKWYGPWDWYSSPVLTYINETDEYFKTDRTKKIMQMLHMSDRVIEAATNSSSDYTRSNDFSKWVKDIKTLGLSSNETRYQVVLNAQEVLASRGFGDLSMNLNINEDDFITSFDFNLDYNYILADWVAFKGNVRLENIGQDFDINLPNSNKW